jgi:hypothetical protein
MCIEMFISTHVPLQAREDHRDGFISEDAFNDLHTQDTVSSGLKDRYKHTCVHTHTHTQTLVTHTHTHTHTHKGA